MFFSFEGLTYLTEQEEAFVGFFSAPESLEIFQNCSWF